MKTMAVAAELSGPDRRLPLEAMVEGEALTFLSKNCDGLPPGGIHTSHHAFDREGATPCGVLTVTREGQTFPRSAMMDLRLTAEIRATPGECDRSQFSEWCWYMWQAVRCIGTTDLSWDYSTIEAVSYPGETRKTTEDGVRVWATDLMVYGYRRPDAGLAVAPAVTAVFLDIDASGNRFLIDSAGNFLQIN